MNAGAKLLIFKEIGKCLPYKLIMEICLRKLSVVLKVVGKYDSKKRDAAGACVSQITNESLRGV
ncbi:hypothetical protein EEL33_02060 [Muribaculaceae bacterium Isolate-037 (Harlan)]|jgi:hypothetical protein|nr:hypothetical protein EEL33_02060 [Muribaculaceae bacterium Isolate-037 (Harlan)]